MSINIKILIATVLIVMSINTINAQELLTKDEAIQTALENNYGVKIAKNNVEVAKNNAEILNSGYLPTVTGTAGATYNVDNTEAQFSNGTTTTLSLFSISA